MTVGMQGDPSAEIQSVAILGLGLIGGSLARDLSARGVRVHGWDADTIALRAARKAGIVQPVSWNEPVDVVVVAAPVLAAQDVLRSVAEKAKGVRLITDVGSTKTSIVRLAEEMGIGDRFVGSHPLAGDHRSGWAASRTGLFADARVFLCPTRSSTDNAMRLASALWTGVGGRPEVIDADLHDVRLAWRSHLPQVVSSALALAIAQTGSAPGDLGPGGRDVTRLAGSSPEVWADVLLDNADALQSALAMMLAQLSGVQRAVSAGDHAGLRRLLSDARDWHQLG
jgi:prephenate dehydrogenase